MLDTSLKSTFTFSRDLIPKEGTEVSGGDLANVVGYPRILSEFKHFPVIRNGLISNPYGVALQTTNYFYFDARLQNRMSGSPVVAMPQKYMSPADVDIMISEEEENQMDPEEWDISEPLDWRTTRPYLLGIHSEEQIEDNRSMDEMHQLMADLEGDDNDSIIARVKILLDQIEHETGLNVAWHSRIIEEIREDIHIDENSSVIPQEISS